MPKPYAILAAALVASGHSLSTVTLTAPRERRRPSPIYANKDRFTDSDIVGISDFESRFAMEPLSKRAGEDRSVFRIARGYELGSQQIFPRALVPCDAHPR